MLTHYRHRRGMYSMAPRRALPRRWIVGGIVALLFLWFVGPPLLRLLGFGSSAEKLPAVLSVEDRGIVTVALEGGDSKRAENSMKLFAGEKLSTGPSGNASLRFFDGTVARLDQNTDVTIGDGMRGNEESSLSLDLAKGSIWLSVPPRSASGSITRTVRTPQLTFLLPPRTEAILSPASLQVFGAEGAGITVSLKKRESVIIGEGQKLVLPQDAQAGEDLYVYRSPLESAANAFLEESRRLWSRANAVAEGGTGGSGAELLTVAKPANGQTVDGSTVVVTGTIGGTVDAVKINGYPAVLDREKGTFTQEVSFPDGESQFALRVQALDGKQNPLAEVRRTVLRGVAAAAGALPAPAVTSPAKTGETYRTNAEEVVIRGTSPAKAAAIIVNNYKLQLFTPEKGTWSYLASLRLGNLKAGTNVYDVVAEDASGRKSAVARLTILHEEGEQGVVASAADSSASSASAPLDPASLPQNAPLTPGVLRVAGEAAMPEFFASGTGFILEGITSAQTATMWVNDYQLQLYKHGKTTWNYIASPQLKTMKQGKNVYKITARNEKGEILDQIVVTIEYR